MQLQIKNGIVTQLFAFNDFGNNFAIQTKLFAQLRELKEYPQDNFFQRIDFFLDVF